MIVISIRDRVVGSYSVPYCFHNEADLSRRMAEMQKDNPFKDDLEVYLLGTFDPEQGFLVCNLKPEFMFNVTSLYEVIDNA